jgi:hypothetical protein
VKIALVALPHPDDVAAPPPLPLAYAAALLEQRRHIVRIYDLAVRGSSPNGDTLASLKTFRPHLAVVVSESLEAATAIEPRLAACGATVLHLGLGMREWASSQEVARALRQSEYSPPPSKDEQNVIIDVFLALDDDLDALPFPARHLLPLEQYPAHTTGGDFQTPLVIGRRVGGGFRMRNPALVVSEIRSIVHEQGILHFVFTGAPLTSEPAWVRGFVAQLRGAQLGIGWEGCVAYERLDPTLLQLLRQGSCEALSFAFDAMAVLDDKESRVALTTAVNLAHELDIKVRGRIGLDPRYSSVPALVDMSATFGLDDAQFRMLPFPAEAERAVGDASSIEGFANLVRERYEASRSRQRFVERYGARIGPMIWRVGRTGILGPNVRRLAFGEEASSEAVAEG